MDLLKDPSFRLKYQESKLKVKLWESEFRKTHGRNPSKVVYDYSFRLILCAQSSSFLFFFAYLK